MKRSRAEKRGVEENGGVEMRAEKDSNEGCGLGWEEQRRREDREEEERGEA